jgi:hypothetical protein
LTEDTQVAAVDAVAPETETDLAVEEVAVEEAAPEAPAAPAAEKRFPKVIKRDEEASIIHYSPKAHEELDPSTRFKD